ncbi:MAG: YARHG domain-containing protein, partial [Erysipelotrichaceae bacterium]|nr:YARHG domain-containing protein [Erysipelotrichaceae bacterium]
KDNDMYCCNIPYVGDGYWICACGNYLTDEDICPRCMKEKDEIKKISYFKKDDLLEGLSDRIKVNTNETVEETIKKYAQHYQQCFGIDEINTINSVDKNVLIARQNQLIDQEIENIIATKKIVFKKNLNLQEDVEAYGQKYAHGVITSEMIIDQLDLAQIKDDYKAYCQKVTDNGTKAKKYGIYGGIALAVVIVAVGTFFLVTKVFMKDSSNTTSSTSDATETSSEFLTVDEYAIDSGYYARVQASTTDNVTFESSDINVATVDSDGIIYGVGGGTATITVTDSDKKTYTCTVTVTGDAVTATDEEATDDDGYILANSSTTLLTDDDLKDLSAQELRYARNEIYARHGCEFIDETLQAYFESCDWYENKGYTATEYYNNLSSIEQANVTLIQEYEEKAE